MSRFSHWLKKNWELLSYLVFGVLTTLLNLVLYAVFSRLFGYEAANSWGNVLANVLCILFAYATNRAFVFASKTRGRAALAEFCKFVTCRLGTLVLDAVVMLVGGNLLAAQGTALMEGLLDRVALWSVAVVTSASVGIIGGADGPTAVFVTGTTSAAQSLWGMTVKVFSNVLVIVLNYVFSKHLIFRKKS
ncbi:MAG: GtrA family protein [Faecalibacterium sp.]